MGVDVAGTVDVALGPTSGVEVAAGLVGVAVDAAAVEVGLGAVRVLLT
jgi:hypothetical protein